MGVDCLGGTYPVFPNFIAGNYTVYNGIVSQLVRQPPGSPDNTVYLLGDSNLNFLTGHVLHPRSVNMGISGVDLRMLMDKLKKLGAANTSGGLRDADAMVIFCGVNTISKEMGYGYTEAQMLANANLMLQRMTDWFTGRGVYIKVNPLSGTVGHVTNARIASINNLIDTHFGAKTGWEVVDVNSTLAPSGNLLAQYTDDGSHLNGDAWHNVIAPAVATALANVGVP